MVPESVSKNPDISQMGVSPGFAKAYLDSQTRHASGGSDSPGHLNPVDGREIHLTKPLGFCGMILRSALDFEA